MTTPPEPEKPESTAPKITVLPQPMLTPEEMEALRQESQAAMKAFRAYFRRKNEQAQQNR